MEMGANGLPWHPQEVARGGQRPPKQVHKGPQEVHNGPQEVPRGPQEVPKGSPRGPKGPQGGPKGFPGSPEGSPGAHKRMSTILIISSITEATPATPYLLIRNHVSRELFETLLDAFGDPSGRRLGASGDLSGPQRILDTPLGTPEAQVYVIGAICLCVIFWTPPDQRKQTP